MFEQIKKLTFFAVALALSGCLMDDVNQERLLIGAAGVAAGAVAVSMLGTTTKVSVAEIRPGTCCSPSRVVEGTRTYRGFCT